MPYEVDLQTSSSFQSWAQTLGMPVDDASGLFVKILYTLLFVAVLALILYLSEKALHSPWGRMMRAIRDNETAAGGHG